MSTGQILRDEVNKLIIYHGSKEIVLKPEYGKGKKYNDYGQGFYCTESNEIAMEWAVDKGRDGFSNEYELDASQLNILDLSDEKFCILDWLAILLQNRTFSLNAPIALEARDYIIENFCSGYLEYDVIKGYRADDSYFSFAQDFLNGTISYRHLSEAMYLGKLGEQIVLKSKKAFEHISFIKYYYSEERIWYPIKHKRDITARSEYLDIRKHKRKKDDIFIIHILEREMKRDDLCI